MIKRVRNTVKVLIKVWFYLATFMPLYFFLILQNIEVRGSNGNFLSFNQFKEQFCSSRPEALFWGGNTVLIVISVFFIHIFKKYWLNAEGTPGRLEESSVERGDVLGYAATYVIPLLAMDINSYRSLVMNFLLFTVIGIFYIKENQLFVNPIFNLIGYRVLVSDDYVYITKLSRRRMKEIINHQETVLMTNVSEEIYIIKEL